MKGQVSALAAGIILFGLISVQGAANWPQFRGAAANGVSLESIPQTWDIDSGNNVAWQTAIPGLGHASPIIWDNRVYLATAVKPGAKQELKVGLYGEGNSFKEAETHQWRLLCLDASDGKVLWNKLGHEAIPRLERHTKGTHCNSTPATDGKRILAILGSEGLFAFDMNGEPLWRKDLGRMDSGPYDAPTLQWGFASSPVLHEGKVIVQCDVLSEQFLAAFDAQSGRELWRTPRREVATWCTPLIDTSGPRPQIIVNGWKHIGGYDFLTGHELWRMKGGGDIPVASPVLAGNVVILTSGHGSYRPMRAVRLDATGDITPPQIGGTNAAVLWCHPRQGNYIQTPIVVGDLVWGCSNDGAVTCFDVHNGTICYTKRLDGTGEAFSASPVAAGGKLYFTGELGDVFVLAASNRLSILATNKLGGQCLATPAISGDRIYFRTLDRLVAIGQTQHAVGASRKQR